MINDVFIFFIKFQVYANSLLLTPCGVFVSSASLTGLIGRESYSGCYPYTRCYLTELVILVTSYSLFPVPVPIQQVMSLSAIDEARMQSMTEIRLNKLKEDKSNFHFWALELKEALRSRGLHGVIFEDDPAAVKLNRLEDEVAGTDKPARARLELKRMRNEYAVAYILRNNIAPGLKSTLPYGATAKELWDLLIPHQEQFTLHAVDKQLMNLKLKDYSSGLELINAAIRIYTHVSSNEEWSKLLTEEVVTRRIVNEFSDPKYLRFKEYLMVQNGQVSLQIKKLQELREKYITYHLIITGTQTGFPVSQRSNETTYSTIHKKDKS